MGPRVKSAKSALSTTDGAMESQGCRGTRNVKVKVGGLDPDRSFSREGFPFPTAEKLCPSQGFKGSFSPRSCGGRRWSFGFDTSDKVSEQYPDIHGCQCLTSARDAIQTGGKAVLARYFA
jgi:hypothetical protein